MSFLVGGISAGSGYVLLDSPGKANTLSNTSLALPSVIAAGVGANGPLSNLALSGPNSLYTPLDATDPAAPRTKPEETGDSPAPTNSAAPAAASSDPPPPSAPPAESKSSAPTVAKVSSGDSSLAGQVVTLVNKERATAGCGALTSESHLTKAAQDFSEDMSARHYFSHVTPEGVPFDKRIIAAGYPKPGAENIAMGSATASQTMTLWMNSPGHRANILNCKLTKIGVGIASSGWYWTQDFGF
jgi:uncharacterized protein YkwD